MVIYTPITPKFGPAPFILSNPSYQEPFCLIILQPLKEEHIKHDKLSDHDTLVICITDIPLYKTENLSVEQIVKAKDLLRNQDWSDVTAEELTRKIYEAVKLVCTLRNPNPKNRSGHEYSSRNREF